MRKRPKIKARRRATRSISFKVIAKPWRIKTCRCRKRTRGVIPAPPSLRGRSTVIPAFRCVRGRERTRTQTFSIPEPGAPANSCGVTFIGPGLAPSAGDDGSAPSLRGLPLSFRGRAAEPGTHNRHAFEPRATVPILRESAFMGPGLAPSARPGMTGVLRHSEAAPRHSGAAQRNPEPITSSIPNPARRCQFAACQRLWVPGSRLRRAPG